MEALPAILAVVGTTMQFSGQMQQARAADAAGLQAAVNANYSAAQREQAAGQEIAAAQRKSFEEKRQARFLASRAMALAGASGASVSDPTVQKLIGDLQGEGAYRAGLAIYEGEDRARQLKQGAASDRYQGIVDYQAGKSRASAMRFQAYGTLAGNTGNIMMSKYGGEQRPAPIEEKSRPADSRFR